MTIVFKVPFSAAFNNASALVFSASARRRSTYFSEAFSASTFLISVSTRNDMKREAVHKLLYKRYDDMKSTILVSNFDASSLKKWMGDRLWSRFHDNGSRLVECIWADARTGGAA